MNEPREPENLFAYVVSVATDVLNDRVTPIEGARKLWRLSGEMHDLPAALLPFVGLAAAWEEEPPSHRPQREQEIVIEMERLRRRFGR